MLVLGDSITPGDFVPEDETFTRQLEKLTAGRSKRIRSMQFPAPEPCKSFTSIKRCKTACSPTACSWRCI